MATKDRHISSNHFAYRVWRGFVNVFLRFYALALITLIVGVTWLAFDYLVGALIRPAQAPGDVVELPKRLDASALGRGREDWRALQAAIHPRSPLAHYHRLDTWIQNDLGNDCTTSGCHAPMPHARRKEIRAFLNMHSTVLHCSVCHMKVEHPQGLSENPRPLPLIWYDIASGNQTDAPAILRALKVLETMRDTKPTSEQKVNLVALLTKAEADSRGNPQLTSLVRHFKALRLEADDWTEMIDLARELLPAHFRGEYGRKLAIKNPTGDPLLGHPDTEEAKRAYLQRTKETGDEQRKQMLAAVHPLRRLELRHCSECHAPGSDLIKFDDLGYPASRIEDLTGQVIFRMIENIASGREFYLPSVLEREHGQSP